MFYSELPIVGNQSLKRNMHYDIFKILIFTRVETYLNFLNKQALQMREERKKEIKQCKDVTFTDFTLSTL